MKEYGIFEMKIGIYRNFSIEQSEVVMLAFVEEAKKQGFEIFTMEKIDGCTTVETMKDLATQSDVIAVFGGDGTVLSVVPYASRSDVAILAVNAGHLGFLTEIERTEISVALQKLKDGNYSVDVRHMLRVSYGKRSAHGLNDVVFMRETRNHTTKLTAYLDGAFVDTFSGDGIIITTPTGSTAYSLAAGGPILSPNLRANALVPLCVHSLYNRPIVFSETETLTVEVNGKGVLLMVDGKEVLKCSEGERFTVDKSTRYAKFVRFNPSDFYSRLFQKLTQWNTGRGR